ncbi:hypothetical protein D2V17_05595 [Aurantiacibacter xanthus]|uniref:Retropepsin-like aspartic endopeptidase domain-containing protein n=1 Tax=Aurantiacibacter xanthus TaxID=1784712 RepID=A0A3A1P9T0_9SPHN|nr:RimK/LysX family protein [Aurantiacibacter xanthus]RIV89741.1 hypothetical protein D2V17_05595 [Aurantiacibacter xanthus]
MPKRASAKPAPVAKKVGWLEHVDLPELGLVREKAKIDTGARTSSLHVDRIAPYVDANGQHRARITKYVRPPGERRKTVHWDVEIRDFRAVKSSNGAVEERAVIVTMLKLGNVTRKREFTLTNRKEMRYQILVGRKGLGKLFLVDPSAKFLLDHDVPAKAKDLSA